jgi:hypothetical protein
MGYDANGVSDVLDAAQAVALPLMLAFASCALYRELFRE